MGKAFLKMHGLGNDFVVLDARSIGTARDLGITAAVTRAIANRRTGVGCDQLIVLERPTDAAATAFMRIFNPDGSESGACGNATRCVAHLLRLEGHSAPEIQTLAGLLPAQFAGPLVSVDMGVAQTDWQAIPVASACDTLHLPVALGSLADPVGTSMGNPHATFFVPDAEAVDLPALGPQLEHHPFFPQRANIGIVQVIDRSILRFRVWERGAGITLACGSGACAAQSAAFRRGLTDRRATLLLDGGQLEIVVREDEHLIMTGPVATAFSGTLPDDLLP